MTVVTPRADATEAWHSEISSVQRQRPLQTFSSTEACFHAKSALRTPFSIDCDAATRKSRRLVYSECETSEVMLLMCVVNAQKERIIITLGTEIYIYVLRADRLKVVE